MSYFRARMRTACNSFSASRMVTCVRLSRTNHLFTSGAGQDAVLDALECWMTECFGGAAQPLARFGRIGVAERSAS